MAAQDFTIKQLDTLPVLTDTLTYSNGSAANLTAATVQFVMRSLVSNATTTAAAATVVSAVAGTVSYTFTTQDTAMAGMYMANWIVTFSGGDVMTWPTDGYIEINVEESLTTPGGQQLISLTEAKGYLNIPATDKTRDTKLLQFIAELAPVIEFYTGPIIQRMIAETYDGSGPFISVRNRPIVSVNSVIETRGAIPYTLTQVPTPDLGTIYSYMFEPFGRIVRRTVGGGMQDFPRALDSVSVVYTAGRATVPPNVTGAVKELLRIHFQHTQQGRPKAGGGGFNEPDDPNQAVMGFFVSGRVREMLAPNRRHSAVA
jgi:hypothetical protein